MLEPKRRITNVSKLSLTHVKDVETGVGLDFQEKSVPQVKNAAKLPTQMFL